MDIRLSDVPNDFSADELKLALYNNLQQIAKFVNKYADFDYLVIPDYNTERFLWDQLIGINTTYSAILVLPDIDIANKFLQDCLKKTLKIGSKSGSVYVVNAEKAKVQLTQPLEFQILQDAAFQQPSNRDQKNRWSGHVARVKTVQCGWFNENNLFDAAATWFPLDPVNWLSWYEDSGPLKFEVGISYLSGQNQQSWTGQWIDFHLDEIQRIIIPTHQEPFRTSEVPQLSKVLEIFLFMDKPPRYYRREMQDIGNEVCFDDIDR